MSIEEARQRAEITSVIFSQRLLAFVHEFGPADDPQAMFDFQTALTRLMVDAMRHQHSELSFGIANYADQVFSDRAMAPLAVIMERVPRAGEKS